MPTSPTHISDDYITETVYLTSSGLLIARIELTTICFTQKCMLVLKR